MASPSPKCSESFFTVTGSMEICPVSVSLLSLNVKNCLAILPPCCLKRRIAQQYNPFLFDDCASFTRHHKFKIGLPHGSVRFQNAEFRRVQSRVYRPFAQSCG